MVVHLGCQGRGGVNLTLKVLRFLKSSYTIRTIGLEKYF